MNYTIKKKVTHVITLKKKKKNSGRLVPFLPLHTYSEYMNHGPFYFLEGESGKKGENLA